MNRLRRKYGCGASLFAALALCSGCDIRSSQSSSTQDHGELMQLVSSTLSQVRASRYSARRHTPWELLHAMVALGPNAKIDTPTSADEITLVQYFQQGGPWEGRSIFETDEHGVRMRPSTVLAEIERHPDQFISYFGIAGLPPTTVIIANGKKITIHDMVKAAIRRYHSSQESTFTLLALSAYGGQEQEWVTTAGQRFCLEDLVRRELDSDPMRLACGGTHSCFGLAQILRQARQAGRVDRPITQEIDRKLSARVHLIRQSQQADGGLPFSLMMDTSTSSGGVSKTQELVMTLGHQLEWMTAYCDPPEMLSPWVQRAVRLLCETIRARALDPLPASPWCHAVHALVRYERILRHSPSTDNPTS